MNKSESITKLAGALSKAQAEMPAVQFNAVNPFLKNKYADLGAIIATAKPVLAKHGLAVSQMTTSKNDRIGVTTLLMHESGEWLESAVYLELGEEKGKSNAQVAGSIITYLRRYSLAAIVGIYADEDGDGNVPPKPEKAQPKAKPASPSIQDAPFDKPKLPEWILKVENSNGEPYWTLPTDKLAHMANSIIKAMEQVTDEKRQEYERKQEAIKHILAERNEQK